MMKNMTKFCCGCSLWQWTLVIAVLFTFSLPAMAIEEPLDNGKYNLSGEESVCCNPDDTIYEVAFTQPQYPEGMDALFKYIAAQIKYPADAKRKRKDGIVITQFVVEKDGSLSDIKVIRNGKLPSLDAEALRVVKTIPKFTPGRNEKGEAVRVKFTLPVNFKLK